MLGSIKSKRKIPLRTEKQASDSIRYVDGTERANQAESIQSSLRRKYSDERTPMNDSSLPKIIQKNKNFTQTSANVKRKRQHRPAEFKSEIKIISELKKGPSRSFAQI